MQLGTLSRNLLYIRLRIATTNVSESTDGGRTGDLGGGEKMGRKKERRRYYSSFYPIIGGFAFSFPLNVSNLYRWRNIWSHVESSFYLFPFSGRERKWRKNGRRSSTGRIVGRRWTEWKSEKRRRRGEKDSVLQEGRGGWKKGKVGNKNESRIMQVSDIRCRGRIVDSIPRGAGPLANRHPRFPGSNVNYLSLCSRNGDLSLSFYK